MLKGGIFHEDNYEAEIAFRNAIIRENMYNPKVEFIPIIQKVDRDDSFKAQKIGSYQYQLTVTIIKYYIKITACGLISEGVVAIFGPSSPQTSSKLKTFFSRTSFRIVFTSQKLSVLSVTSWVYHIS